MKQLFPTCFLLICFANIARADLIISQYVETDFGSTPKGIELWNSGTTVIDFSVTNLIIRQGSSGAALSDLAGTSITSGTLSAGAVFVIGSSDVGTYLSDSSLDSVMFVSYGFNFNGDDALAVVLGGTTTDTLGLPGVDPGTAWSNNGVSTANQNIAIKLGFVAGQPGGFTDPSIRFETVSTSPSSVGGLAGFGVAPNAVPEPTLLSFLASISVLSLIRNRRREQHR
ncbi:MAG: hypothetical protein KDB03_26635 [Planctomycetales bacterium]|nr:hypothetical protein [Planctomycetales bacterium]